MIKALETKPGAQFRPFIIEGWDHVNEESVVESNFAFPSLWEVRQLIVPYRDPIYANEPGYYNEGYVNLTDPDGIVNTHRDDEPWSLIFVSLVGSAKVRIKHLHERRFTEAEVEPGDALKIVNPKEFKQRPRHEIINLSPFTRVSYGEYTAPGE